MPEPNDLAGGPLVGGALGSSNTQQVMKLPEYAQVVGIADAPERVGVHGAATQNVGVWGKSENTVGVRAESNTAASPALEARNLKLGGQAAKFDGHVYITGNITVEMDIILPGAGDVAEDFDVHDASAADPGTVMAFGDGGVLTPTSARYDSRVAGIVAGAGTFRPAVILDRRPSSTPRAPIALTGKVYCKVDADFGAIAAGDLLTSSPTLGHAMRVDDRTQAQGAVVGKAMQALKRGRGLIPVLVTR